MGIFCSKPIHETTRGEEKKWDPIGERHACHSQSDYSCSASGADRPPSFASWQMN